MTSPEMSQIAKILDEILVWTRIQAIDKAKNALQEALPDMSARMVYQLSTGGSSRQISSSAGVSPATVLRYWKKWSRLGLMKEDSKQKGTFLRTFDLEDFDLAPSIPAAKPNDGGTREREVPLAETR
jgi:hypothetical protein